MAAISFKCPNCGGDLRFDPETQKYKCEYCISTFTQAELEAANPQARQADGQPAPEKMRPAGGRAQDAAGAGADAGSDAGAGKAVVYSCPSCGAEIVTDATTAASFCYYCHNPVVLQGNLSGEFEPDLVIPFAYSRKQAVDIFLKYVRGKKFVPRNFFSEEQIEKISGVYFPFWEYSCTADGEWRGRGDRINVFRRGASEVTRTEVYEVERTGELMFDNITHGALKKMNRQLVEAVQPFQLEKAQKFSMGYLSGFLAEKRDVESSTLADGLRGEVDRHAQGMMRASVGGYSVVQEKSHEVRMRAEEWKYLLLPVWVLTYKGADDKLYYYAMNGQTGRVSGVLPIDKKRVITVFFCIFAAVFVILLMGGYFLW